MEQNGMRYRLDFMVMPIMVENRGVEFADAIVTSKGKVICDLFNSYYDEVGNATFFKDSPKHFTKKQFVFTEKDFDDKTRIIHISLPEEHEGSMVYCTAYVFVCGMKNGKINTFSMYTIEKSMGDITFIGKMHKGSHINYGLATGSAEGDIQRIRELTADK